METHILKTQNYSNHARIVPMYHGALMLMILLSLIGASINLAKSWGDPTRFYSAALLLVVFICLAFFVVFVRRFSLMAQDRAIRAEENLRHYIMTGKPLDGRLSMRQIVGLRFAGDDEYLALEKRAFEENLSEKQIKQAVKNWKGDYYRV